MDRRTFVLLSGAASGSLLIPPLRPPLIRPGGKRGWAQGRLAFEFDDQHRWSLWYRGEGPSVPLVAPTAAGIRLSDRLVTLADLDDVSVNAGTPASGESTVLRGRTAGAFVEAEFLTARLADTPQAAITLRIYPETAQPLVAGVRYGLVPAAQILGGAGDLLASLNGADSWSPSSVELAQVPAGAPDRVSYGTLGLTRRVGSTSRGLALAFDPGEPGTATVRLAVEGLEARSDWAPPRPVAPAGDSSTVRLCYDPTGDGLTALRALYAAANPTDHQWLATAVAPAGWCSGSELGTDVRESDVLANLDFAAAHFDPRFFRYLRLDDGFARSVGDWDTNDAFPHGHRWLTERIHARGFLAGLWLAPFGASDASGIPSAHPDWIVAGASGPVVMETRTAWGGTVYALDGAHPDVQDHLRQLAGRAVRDWGYDALTLDFLRWGDAGTTHFGGATGAEAYRAGLAALRTGAGTEAFLLGCGARLQHAAGYVNGMRIGADVGACWSELAAPARAAASRSFYQRNTWLNDPGPLVVRPPLSLGEAQAWTALVAVTGGLTMCSDDLTKLPPERIELLQRALPPAPVAGRPVDAAILPRDAPPALLVGATEVPIAGPWRLRTGDDPSYGSQEFDETTWETVSVPGDWEDAGHANYAGYAWYRVRFAAPAAPGETDGSRVLLRVGQIKDADETFLNGARVGGTGDFPPTVRDAGTTFRIYPVPTQAVNWGGENVLAIRVYNERGPGGLWSIRDDAPPATWVSAGAPDWLTVVHVNWGEIDAPLTLPLSALDLPAGVYHVYDAWANRPLAATTDGLHATVPAHGALTVALRPAGAEPRVVGTTRHLIQGAVDLRDERWDAGARTLHATSRNLDGRPYAVTVAMPTGWAPAEYHGDRPAAVRRVDSEYVVLEWPAGEVGDISWQLAFRPAPRRGAHQKTP